MQGQHGIAKLNTLQNHIPTTQMPNQAAISAHNLSCIRGDNQLFRDVSFEVHRGQCLHVTGPNGCGKTSLLRLICGINTTEEGQIAWCGTDINDNPTFLSQSVYLGHKEGLKNELTAIENLRYYQLLETKQDELVLDDVLAKMGILNCADLLAQQLSFGQRRRLSFARLLMADFQLWILDEPFTGIDIAGRDLIESLCVNHLKNKGLIIMTHHQSLTDSRLNQYRSELKLGSA